MPSPQAQLLDDVIVFAKFEGMSTQSARHDLQEDKAAWMENLQPIGANNLLSVPAAGVAIASLAGEIITKKFFFQFGQSTDYDICFTESGAGYAVTYPGGVATQFALAGTFSQTPDCTQWGTERILIADSVAGYCTWDTVVFVKYGGVSPNITITAGGAGYTNPSVAITTSGAGAGATATVQQTSGVVTGITLTAAGSGYAAGDTVTFTITDTGPGAAATATGNVWPNSPNPKPTTLAVGFGRVWLAQAGVFTYTGTLGYDNFASGNASGSTTIRDADLTHTIEALRFLNNYLFIFGDSSIRSIGSISVSGTTTSFTVTILSSDQGTTFRDSILSYNKLVLFANTVGVFAVFGNSVEKISDDMDGIFRNIDFAHVPTAALNDLNNIRCYLLLVRYNDPLASARGLILTFMNKKWFVINMDGNAPVDIIQTALVDGVYNTIASAVDGDSGDASIIPLLSDADTAVPIILRTSLTSHGTPVIGKNIGRYAVAQTAGNQADLTLTLQSERTPDEPIDYNLSNALSFVNNSSGALQFQNQGGGNLNFITNQAGFFYHTGMSSGVAGVYLGAELTGDVINYTLNSIMLEYAFAAAFTSMKTASPTVLA
jgi:hypothetical protein